MLCVFVKCPLVLTCDTRFVLLIKMGFIEVTLYIKSIIIAIIFYRTNVSTSHLGYKHAWMDIYMHILCMLLLNVVYGNACLIDSSIVFTDINGQRLSVCLCERIIMSKVRAKKKPRRNTKQTSAAET